MLWLLAAVGFGAWLLALSFQLADVSTARFDLRRLARRTRGTVRLHPVAWVVPFAAFAAVVFGIGVHLASGFFTPLNPLLSVISVLVLVLWAVFAWLVVSTALMRRAADSYRAVRDELREVAGTRVQQEVLDELRSRLRAIDESTDRAAPVATPTVRSDFVWLLRRPQRLVPPIIAVVTLVDVCLAAAAQGANGVLVPFAALAIVVSVLLAFDGARLSVRLVAGVRLAQSGHRSEAEHLLAEAEKTAKKRVAGLGDRVARALEILRKQQDS
jgi:uncharacterized membrane protein